MTALEYSTCATGYSWLWNSIHIQIKSYYNHKNGTESHEMLNIAYICMYLNITRQKHSEQDHEAIPGPKLYTSAVCVYYNSVANMGGFIGHDNLTIPEYSKLSNVNNSTVVNDKEEIYSDPGKLIFGRNLCSSWKQKD